MITNVQQIAAANLLIDRGYTSHEHLAGVALIHMNGRLYDPLLRRFLNADENIQDPTNTQNYNKYGYVMNNPLMYNDPSGEFIWWLAGAIIGGYASGVQANGGNWNPMKWDWSKTWSAVVGGAFAGAGLGMVIENTGASGGVKILEGSLAGALGGAFNAITSGKNILSGALTGSFFQAGFAGINYVSSNFINSPSTYRDNNTTGSYEDYLSSIGVMTYETYLIAEVVIKVKGKGNKNTWNSAGNFAYNQAVMEGGSLNALQGFNRDINRLNLGYAIANSVAAQQIEAFEKFMFIELPLQYAGGAVLSVAWRAVGVGRLALNTYSRVISSNTNRVFWSGGKPALNAAMEYANTVGATTLEMTNVRKGLSAIGNGLNSVVGKNLSWKIMEPVWKTTSAAYSTGARGTANTFINTAGYNNGRIWSTVEAPILQSNGIGVRYHWVFP